MPGVGVISDTGVGTVSARTAGTTACDAASAFFRLLSAFLSSRIWALSAEDIGAANVAAASACAAGIVNSRFCYFSRGACALFAGEDMCCWEGHYRSMR